MVKWRFLGENQEENYVTLLRSTLGEWYSRRREGWHVSDVVLCPRQHAFKTTDPKSVIPTDREINLYSSGKSIHEAIQKLFMSNRMRFEIEKYVEYEGVQGNVDIYDKKKNEPLEFKTIRAAAINQPKSFHLEQLMYYMAMLDVSVGQIIYQCLLQYAGNPFVSFEVTMEENERAAQLMKLKREIVSLQLAVEMKDPKRARGVYLDKQMMWLCRECPYLLRCERIYREEQLQLTRDKKLEIRSRIL